MIIAVFATNKKEDEKRKSRKKNKRTKEKLFMMCSNSHNLQCDKVNWTLEYQFLLSNYGHNQALETIDFESGSDDDQNASYRVPTLIQF